MDEKYKIKIEKKEDVDTDVFRLNGEIEKATLLQEYLEKGRTDHQNLFMEIDNLNKRTKSLVNRLESKIPKSVEEMEDLNDDIKKLQKHYDLIEKLKSEMHTVEWRTEEVQKQFDSLNLALDKEEIDSLQ